MPASSVTAHSGTPTRRSRSLRTIRIWPPGELPAICVKRTYVRLDNLARLGHDGARS